MAPWLSWIILGLVAGSLAKFLVPGRDLPGCIVTILLGTAGAFVGGLLGAALGISESPAGALELHSVLLATLGAVIVLVGVRLLARRMRARRERLAGPLDR
ncbi:MAG: GlsB/YeaQ/YmgE family stress response membrane protein [Gemmatimonadaceae bacterium]